MKAHKLIAFIENDLNNKNQICNAIAYDDEYFEAMCNRGDFEEIEED